MKPKELYLYSPIYDFVAETLISAMEEASSQDIVIRVNTPGGNPIAGWGIIAKMQELKNSVKIKVDGAAQSMGAFMLLFAEEVEALDVSSFMLHRAAMTAPTAEDKAFLDKVNNDLRSKLEAKVGAAKFKEVTGISIKNLFEAEERIDVNLSSKQMKDLGIVTKITKLTPQDLNAFNDKMQRIAAVSEPIIQIQNKMTIEKLKAEHPDLFAQIYKQGIEAEKDRAGAWLAFADVDIEAVKKGVDDGKEISQKQMAEFSRKAISAESLKKLENENPAAVVVDDPTLNTPEAKKAKEVEAFNNKTFELLGLKK